MNDLLVEDEVKGSREKVTDVSLMVGEQVKSRVKSSK